MIMNCICLSIYSQIYAFVQVVSFQTYLCTVFSKLIVHSSIQSHLYMCVLLLPKSSYILLSLSLPHLTRISCIQKCASFSEQFCHLIAQGCPILSSGYCMCVVLHVLPVFCWDYSRLSTLITPPKNMPLAKLNCPEV